MALFGSSVEYGLHCLLWLVGPSSEPASSRDLADLQGVSQSFMAKIMPKLEKAGIVEASEGIRGGYRLARPASEISFLDVVDAIEGEKPIFDCQNIRSRCAVFDGKAPSWATDGVCAIHAVMLRAEKMMREELARSNLAEVAKTFGRKAPESFGEEVQDWLNSRMQARSEARTEARADADPKKRRRSDT